MRTFVTLPRCGGKRFLTETKPLPLDSLFEIAFLPESMRIDACETVRKIITETNRNIFRIYERRIERMKYELFKELERKIYERTFEGN